MNVPGLPLFTHLSPEAAAVQVFCDVFELAFGPVGLGDPADDELFGDVGAEGFLGPTAVGLFERGEFGGGDMAGLAENGMAIGKGVEAIQAVGNVATKEVVIEEFSDLFAGAVADFFAFPFGDGKHDGEDEAPDVALGGDGFAAEVHDMKADAVLVAKFEGADAIADVAAQAIELGDNQMVNAAGGEAVHQEASTIAIADGNGPGGIGVGKDMLGGDGEFFEAGIFDGAFFLEFEGIVLFIGGNAAIDGGARHCGLRIADWGIHTV